MNNLPMEYLFFIALAAGVAGITLLLGSPVGCLSFMLLLFLFAILLIIRTWHDRGFYLICGSVPLAIACSIMNIWMGLFTVCMLASIVCGALGLLTTRQDLRYFAFFCGSSFFIALLIELSNHVLLPFLILSSMTAIILVIQSVRMYQFRKSYTGA
jgi:hypothetical protein